MNEWSTANTEFDGERWKMTAVDALTATTTTTATRTTTALLQKLNLHL
jgi:hypothetical protein